MGQDSDEGVQYLFFPKRITSLSQEKMTVYERVQTEWLGKYDPIVTRKLQISGTTCVQHSNEDRKANWSSPHKGRK